MAVRGKDGKLEEVDPIWKDFAKPAEDFTQDFQDLAQAMEPGFNDVEAIGYIKTRTLFAMLMDLMDSKEDPMAFKQAHAIWESIKFDLDNRMLYQINVLEGTGKLKKGELPNPFNQ